MITDTQWLLRAVTAGLEQAGIAQCVTAPNVLTYEAALADLNQYPASVIFVLPGALNVSHDIEGGMPIKADISREVTLFISAAATGVPGGDMDTANHMTDRVLQKLMWNSLGQDGRVICKPRTAAPLSIVWEDAPGRAVWTMIVEVTSFETEF